MKKFILLLTVFTALSCSTSKFIKTGFDDSNVRSSLPETASVAIITELPSNAKKIVEIGICKGQVPGGGVFSDRTDKAIEKIKSCARKNGGNAIILDKNEDGGLFTEFGYSQQVAKAQGRVYYIEF